MKKESAVVGDVIFKNYDSKGQTGWLALSLK